MQPAKQWGRRATVLCLYSPHTKESLSLSYRYASSVPKHVPAQPIALDKQQKNIPRTEHNGQGNQIPVLERNGPLVRRAQRVHSDREIIDPLSLEKTLQAHQQANQESIIIRYQQTQGPPESMRKRKQAIPTTSAHLELEREDIQEGRGQWEDYTGSPRALSLDWEIVGSISRNLSVPWLNVLNEREPSRDSAAARLSEEIRAADLYFSPSQAEWAATNTAVKSLESFVLKVNPAHKKLDIIGSRASGLATPLSDLDLNLVVADESGTPSKTYQKKFLANLFKTMKWSKGINKGQFNASYYAAHARVPIIVGTHISGLEFQIQSASSCYGSLEVVKHLCAEYPTVRPLFKIIKQSLKMRGLSDGHLGGLTSYPLINMIAVSLKMNAKTTDAFDFGRHLLQFLEYWSSIDLYTTGITHIPSTYLTRTDPATTTNTDTPLSPFSTPQLAARSIDLITQDPVGATPIEFDVRKDLATIHDSQNNFMLTLHDPANPHNDLGRSAYAIKHIQATFAEMLGKLKGDMKEWDARVRVDGDVGGKEDAPSLLRALIEGDYSLYNMERKRVTAKRENVEFEFDDVEEEDEDLVDDFRRRFD